MSDDQPPPLAKRVPHAFTRHGITIEDPYAWLRDPGYPEVTDPEVLGYLECRERLFRSGHEAASRRLSTPSSPR